MVWNCCVKEPQSCRGSTTPAAGFSSVALLGSGAGEGSLLATGSGAGAAAGGIGQVAAAGAASAFDAAPGVPMVKFIPLRVCMVIFCTSSAWMVALSAREFCSSQNCTCLSSSMRFSRSSTFRLGTSHCERLGTAELLLVPPKPLLALLARFCRKSKPGTNLPKPEVSVLLISVSCGGCCAERELNGSRTRVGTRRSHRTYQLSSLPPPPSLPASGASQPLPAPESKLPKSGAAGASKGT